MNNVYLCTSIYCARNETCGSNHGLKGRVVPNPGPGQFPECPVCHTTLLKMTQIDYDRKVELCEKRKQRHFRNNPLTK